MAVAYILTTPLTTMKDNLNHEITKHRLGAIGWSTLTALDYITYLCCNNQTICHINAVTSLFLSYVLLQSATEGAIESMRRAYGTKCPSL